MYLITAYFDETTNRILDRYKYKIADATGNTFMTDNKVPPHLTLSQIEARGGDILMPNFMKLDRLITSGEIYIVSVGMLLPYVLYATPVLNDYLQSTSHTVYNTMCNIPKTTISRYYTPASWLPHITLGKKLTREQMHSAISVLQTDFSPIKAQIVRLGLSQVNPHKDLLSINL